MNNGPEWHCEQGHWHRTYAGMLDCNEAYRPMISAIAESYATSAAEIIASVKAAGYRKADLPDAARWALQDAGVSASEREDALLAAGLIKPLQQDFGAMVEEFSPRPKPPCPTCGSRNVRKAFVYWQCLTCGVDWLESEPQNAYKPTRSTK
jgi:hypothetical protein